MDDFYMTKDEDLWINYMIALAGNPNMCGNSVEGLAALSDTVLSEFKQRFRD